jgi:hypothetical protein
MSTSILHTKRQRRAAQLATTVRRQAAATRNQQVAADATDAPDPEADASADLDDASMSDVPATEALTDAMRKEIVDNGRHFSKIATRFSFDDTTPSYNSWVIQFKAELESYGLENTVTDRRQEDSPLSMLSHKIVYNMILQCVPKSVMPSITVTLSEHSAFEAWRVLRRQYIGDEATYLQGLETRFQRVIWSDGEEFNAFEGRFEQIVSELESAGQIKPDHVKKAVFMHAIESSNKKDVRGVHVFDRLNTTSKIHFEKAFQEWMVHLRVEAQQIHGAIANEVANRRGTKRAHSDHPDQPAREESLPISFVTPIGPSSSSSFMSMPPTRPPAFHSQRSNRAPPVCFNMARSGTCRFGASCRFSHDSPTPVRQIHGGGASFQQKPELCKMFQVGRCRFGDKCRHVHSEPSNGGPRQGSGQNAGRQQLGRVDYQGQEQFQQSGASSSSLS